MLKFCSKCQKAYVDELGAICPVCGSPLIEIPVGQPDNSCKLDMGDANAISGGVHMADNHSVNHNSVSNSTSNIDSHNVITNNITQVERQKTAEEMWQEKKNAEERTYYSQSGIFRYRIQNYGKGLGAVYTGRIDRSF